MEGRDVTVGGVNGRKGGAGVFRYNKTVIRSENVAQRRFEVYEVVHVQPSECVEHGILPNVSLRRSVERMDEAVGPLGAGARIGAVDEGLLALDVARMGFPVACIMIMIIIMMIIIMIIITIIIMIIMIIIIIITIIITIMITIMITIIIIKFNNMSVEYNETILRYF